MAKQNTVMNNDPTIIDNVQQDPLIRQLVEPIERSLAQKWNISLKLKTIRDIAHDRHEVLHDSI